MQTSFVLIVLFLGLIIYFKKPKWVFFYWFLIEPVIYPIWTIFMKIVDYETLLSTSMFSSVARRNYIIILLLIEISRKGINPLRSMKNILISLLVLFFYLIAQNLFINLYIEGVWQILITSISLVILYALAEINNKLLPTSKSLFIFTLLLVAYELLWVILNINNLFAFIPFNIGYYISKSGYTHELELNLISGSFLRFNKLGNFLTTIYLFIAIEYFHNHFIKSKYFWSISLCFLFMIALTGAKMSVAIFFITIIICLITYYKKNRITATIATICCILTPFSIAIIYSLSTEIKLGGINRMVEGFMNVFTGNNDSVNTLSLSTYLFDNFFYNNPILGSGLSYLGENAYNRGPNGWELVYLQNDARIIYILIEYGIIGLIFTSLFFIRIFESIKKKVIKTERVKINICIFYFLILSITELGIFDSTIFPMLFLYSKIYICNKNENSRIKYPNIKTSH